MDVYLVPVGADRHELYCEVPDEVGPDEQHDVQIVIEGRTESKTTAQESVGTTIVRWARVWHDVSSRGFAQRLRHRFRDMLAEAERERRQGRAAVERGWFGRVKARVMRWVAESIAEQRLLWHLRGQTEARLYYPDDLDEAQAGAMLGSHLGRDFDKHRFWLIIDTLGFIASGLFFFVPGPNLFAYYFAFRLVGHFLSLRGARQGLVKVQWVTEKSAPLAELRRVLNLTPADRESRVHDVAHRLRLEHLASFFERTAIP